VALDGSLYIADTNNNRIRRVGVDGIIATVAGKTTGAADIGDGGPATQAILITPSGIAVAPDGSLYIADKQHDRIRRVGSDGIIPPLAGPGSNGSSGDDGPATQATLTFPSGIAVAPDGGVYVADTNNSRIRWLGSVMLGISVNEIVIAS